MKRVSGFCSWEGYLQENKGIGQRTYKVLHLGWDWNISWTSDMKAHCTKEIPRRVMLHWKGDRWKERRGRRWNQWLGCQLVRGLQEERSGMNPYTFEWGEPHMEELLYPHRLVSEKNSEGVLNYISPTLPLGSGTDLMKCWIWHLKPQRGGISAVPHIWDILPTPPAHA